MSGPNERREEVEEKAAELVIRLGAGPLAPDERRALDRWLAEDPGHRAAFERARATWAELAGLREAPGTLAMDVASPRPPRSGLVASAWAGALAASLLLAVGLGAFWIGDPFVALTADYRAGPGEVRTVTLPDGSRMDLGPDSAVDLRFDGRERRIALLAGAVHLAVAPTTEGEKRPFLVEAANGTTRALGTQFAVDRRSDAVRVTVTEHRVEVRATPADGPAGAVVVAEGQSVRYGRGTGLGAVEAVALDDAMAWRRGRLVFDRVPLSEVVAELNRYRRGRIIVADAALSERRVSGVFETSALDAALAVVARELGARTVAVPPFVTLLY